MPKRETNERIARYGKGFSKILSTLNDDVTVPNFNSTLMRNHQQNQVHVHDKNTLHQHKQPRMRSSRDDFNGGQSYPDINNTTMASNFEGHRMTIQHDGHHYEETSGGFFKSGKISTNQGSNFASPKFEIGLDKLKKKHNSTLRGAKDNLGYGASVPIVAIYQQNPSDDPNMSKNQSPSNSRNHKTDSKLASANITPSKIKKLKKYDTEVKHNIANHRTEEGTHESTR